MSDARTERDLHDEIVARVDRIIEVGQSDPELSHADEDELVLGLCYRYCPEPVVRELRRLQAADLIRWYG
jgi:hypothetical protein